jgi:hypothetical protein
MVNTDEAANATVVRKPIEWNASSEEINTL